ncbi:MAG: right-handed parallel beta-helix repeat-containing protein [Mycobacteriaceae bacterium]|nr:right-handed parallel beta-helix repeat-containing protein [Mycobacteriaceae bacterium]
MKRALFFVFFGIALCMCAMTSAAQAQASRTWVSGVGDDANPCSRTAPCKTWAGAISKTAAGGEIDALDPGGFGALSIGKALVIDGGGGQVASTLVSGVNQSAFYINGGANDQITIRNIRINGISQSSGPATGPGIKFNSGASLSVENVFLFNFGGNGIDFQPTVRAFLHVEHTTIENAGGDGIAISTAASGGGLNRVEISDSHIFNSGANGIRVLNNSRVELYSDRITRNGLASGDGLLVNGSSIVSANDCLISNNGTNGVHSQGGGSVLESDSTVTDNGNIGNFLDGGTIFTGGNNRVQNNTGGNGGFSGSIPLS